MTELHADAALALMPATAEAAALAAARQAVIDEASELVEHWDGDDPPGIGSLADAIGRLAAALAATGGEDGGGTMRVARSSTTSMRVRVPSRPSRRSPSRAWSRRQRRAALRFT